MIFISTESCSCGYTVYIEKEIQPSKRKRFLRFADAKGNTLSFCPDCCKLLHKSVAAV